MLPYFRVLLSDIVLAVTMDFDTSGILSRRGSCGHARTYSMSVMVVFVSSGTLRNDRYGTFIEGHEPSPAQIWPCAMRIVSLIIDIVARDGHTLCSASRRYNTHQLRRNAQNFSVHRWFPILVFLDNTQCPLTRRCGQGITTLDRVNE